MLVLLVLLLLLGPAVAEPSPEQTQVALARHASHTLDMMDKHGCKQLEYRSVFDSTLEMAFIDLDLALLKLQRVVDNDLDEVTYNVRKRDVDHRAGAIIGAVFVMADTSLQRGCFKRRRSLLPADRQEVRRCKICSVPAACPDRDRRRARQGTALASFTCAVMV
jgi:hypothetical protein